MIIYVKIGKKDTDKYLQVYKPSKIVLSLLPENHYNFEMYFAYLQEQLEILGTEEYTHSNELDLIGLMGVHGWRVVGDTNLFEIEFVELVRYAAQFHNSNLNISNNALDKIDIEPPKWGNIDSKDSVGKIDENGNLVLNDNGLKLFSKQ